MPTPAGVYTPAAVTFGLPLHTPPGVIGVSVSGTGCAQYAWSAPAFTVGGWFTVTVVVAVPGQLPTVPVSTTVLVPAGVKVSEGPGGCAMEFTVHW